MKILALSALLLVGNAVCPARAHHSYSMFDGAHPRQVTGTVAKLEWTNPHVYLWVYVPDPAAAGRYILYAFENGSPNVLANNGWSRNSFAPRETVTISYWPLKDGRPGGHFVTAQFADGRTLRGAGGPPGAAGKKP